MHRSILNHLKLIGVSQKKLLSQTRWEIDGKSFRSLLQMLRRDVEYSFAFGSSSHFVHGSWCDLWLNHLQRKGTERKSLDKAEQLITRFNDDGREIDSDFMAFFGDFRAHHLSTDLVKRYIVQRKEKGAANGTLNRELSGLKRMFNLGIQAEKIYRRPHVPKLKESPPRQGFFEYGEFVAFRKALPEYFRPVVTFAYYTGWRKQEILKLRWNQVDLNARTVRLEAGTTKNGKGRLVKLDGELLETIEAQWERPRSQKLPAPYPDLPVRLSPRRKTDQGFSKSVG